MVTTENEETLSQIEGIITNIKEHPLGNNPLAITSYVNIQTYVARYIFYIQGDAESALNKFKELKTLLQRYKIENLNKIVEDEIKSMKDTLATWKNLDLSLKERIEKSNLQDYLQNALNIIRNQNIEN